MPADEASTAQVMWRRHGTTGADVSRVLDRAPNLTWLHTDTAGVDDLPTAELAARGITVTTTTAYTDAVAEWVTAAVLLAGKDAFAYMRASDTRRWEPGTGAPRLITGTRALVIGGGRIGSRAALLLRGMGVTVEIVTSRTGAGWRDRLGAVDWLVLTCPLTAATRGLVDGDVLAALPSGAWLINVARGEVVDETALTTALDAGQLGGAVLDTFATEPLPADHFLWGRPNVLVLPHDAWRAAGAGRRQAEDFLEHLACHRSGQPFA